MTTRIRVSIAAAIVGLSLGGCAGQITYRPPVAQSPTITKIVNAPLDQVWAKSVPALSKEFFVINNIDKASGLINVSYSGDPAKYVDCGYLHSYVKNARGERNYDFPVAAPSADYEAMVNETLYRVHRSMSLDGRVNLIFEADGAKTKVTANTRYVLTRKLSILQAGTQIPQGVEDQIAFNSNGNASFPSLVVDMGEATTCRANGELEADVLNAVR